MPVWPRIAAFGLSLALMACATEAVQLRNPAGMTVQCGPYYGKTVGLTGLRLDQTLRDCVSDFQRQGYERVANPS